jgi:hypothetical protein
MHVAACWQLKLSLARLLMRKLAQLVCQNKLLYINTGTAYTAAQYLNRYVTEPGCSHKSAVTAVSYLCPACWEGGSRQSRAEHMLWSVTSRHQPHRTSLLVGYSRSPSTVLLHNGPHRSSEFPMNQAPTCLPTSCCI